MADKPVRVFLPWKWVSETGKIKRRERKRKEFKKFPFCHKNFVPPSYKKYQESENLKAIDFGTL
jgi:hypothetical protein